MSSGFDDRVEARLIGLRMAADAHDGHMSTVESPANVPSELHNRNSNSDHSSTLSSNNSHSSNSLIINNNASVTARRAQLPDHAISLSEQASKNTYHKFVQNNLIIKQGLLDKKKGLFAKRRMFLITEGPAIYYVDPDAMELKGTISWTGDMRIEQKDMKTFLIHVLGRTYHLTDPEQDATTWCKSLTSIHYRYYNSDPNRTLSSTATYSSTSSSSLQPTVPVTEL